MSDKPARIGFNVWANGTVYHLIKLRLAPHQTRAVDLRKLRDAQQADFKGNKIPAGATDGSVHWIRLDNLPVTGRLVLIARHGGVASDYDCPGCQCPADDTALTVTPATAYMPPGGTAQMTATETATNCNGQNYYYDETDASSWSSSNTSVATINSTGLATALAGGSAGMTARLGACTYNPYYNCNCTSFTLTGAGSCSVLVPTSLKVINSPVPVISLSTYVHGCQDSDRCCYSVPGPGPERKGLVHRIGNRSQYDDPAGEGTGLRRQRDVLWGPHAQLGQRRPVVVPRHLDVR